MDGVTLLQEAKKAGLQVIADGDRLVVRGPRSAEPVVKRLLADKAEVMQVLRHEAVRPSSSSSSSPVPQYPSDLPERWRELYEERAAIREYDGGQAREHAEAEAFKEVLDLMRKAETCLRSVSDPGVNDLNKA